MVPIILSVKYFISQIGSGCKLHVENRRCTEKLPIKLIINYFLSLTRQAKQVPRIKAEGIQSCYLCNQYLSDF